MPRIGLLATIFVAGFIAATGSACAGERPQVDWHGPGWLGTGWPGNWARDPAPGLYGASAYRRDPYAPYRNDNGCYRMLPVETPHGVQLRRVFVCDY